MDFDTFSKSDFRVVKVKACEAVKKSKKLLKFVLDDGTGTDRVILSGIHDYYAPEELVGKTCIAITNLPPRPMMGIDSCGMLISAVHHEDGQEKLNLLMVDDRIPAGAKLYWRQEKIEVIELPLFGNLQKQSESLESYGRKLVDWLNCDKIRSKIQKRDLERFQSGFEQVLFAYLKERNIDLFSILSTGGLNKQKQQATSGLKMMSLYVSRLLEVTEQSIRKQYDRNPVVEQIKAYIELNYEKEINRKDLSALVFLNPDYMDRVFKEQEGISVNRYINKVRMEKAQLLLEKTQMQVLEIADKVGYSSLSNFNMQFKQYCGLSPNQYRKRIRNRQNVEIQ